ncbi:MAG: recombination mediator RecR [Gammaproteobacteria bacterium]|nr:recombination mediator RecR [Gammaproteobacteria bacterium]
MADQRTIEALRRALSRLPGVGPRSAQRMAFHLLERDREGARLIIDTLERALSDVGHCSRCNNFSESEVCEICSSARRDAGLLCVVESPADLEAMEKAGFYQGMYFVLMGRISPLDGVSLDELGVAQLRILLDSGVVQEVILATNLTVEGEATAHALTELLRGRGITVSRLAQGVPAGGELEYLDGVTLEHALSGRHEL